MADTDYADLAQLRDRLNLDDTNTAPDAMLQGILNTAARVVDAVSRYPHGGLSTAPGPAFSESASLTRYYADPYMTPRPEPVPIHDLLSVTSITRGGTALVAVTDYLLAPWDSAALPKTELVLAQGAGSASTTMLGRYTNLAITGTWGYCTAGTRPPEVAEATLLQAVILYQRYGLDVEALANMMGDPLKAADATVVRMLLGVTRWASLRLA